MIVMILALIVGIVISLFVLIMAIVDIVIKNTVDLSDAKQDEKNE